MMRNWMITAWLCSPLAGEPPYLDAVLEGELARRLGYLRNHKLTRDTKLKDIDKPPIPLAKEEIGGKAVWCVSDPIIPNPAAEWHDKQAKRFDTSQSLLVAPEYRKKLLTSSGPYKQRYAPIRARLIESITWFARGDRKGLNKLLKKVPALGKHRNTGYGRVWKWQYEEVGSDYSLYATRQGTPVLMRTMPLGEHLAGVGGYRKSYGGGWTPYWHPDNYTEIAIPV